MPMLDPVLLTKSESRERCILRARAALEKSSDFLEDLDAQDIAIINVIRACEACIDVAMRIIKIDNLGLPNTNADSFSILAKQKVISRQLAERMIRMVGFRNVAVHEYTKLNYEIVMSVIRRDLDDVLNFIGIAIRHNAPKT